ncbi:hypothetical protein FRC16_008063 [Serendipita sp. 398]|nr:hypothetical protein FRC16_008063 [Serendipita sp. 398]
MYNPNASRFGKYTELQFTDRGRLSGVKTLDYYLEKNRVAGFPSGERNFHIFYYLLAGASPEERQHLHLVDKATYRYLGPYRRPFNRDEDSNRFDQLKVALKAIGFSKRHVAQACQLLAAILHLGNLDFIHDKHRNEDAAVVRNTDILEIVAEFLGVPPADLEATLSYKTKLVKKELCTVFLDEEGASANRDDLAKTLYSLLFAWLNESINQKLCRDDFSTFIGLFDLPGTQNLPQGAIRSNSLDQFCVNFANERLQNWVQNRIFDRHTEEYAAEGIERYSPQIQYFDNSECVRMITHHTGGLIHIMDDQARRAPKKTEHTMLEAFSKRWANHASYKTGGTDRTGFPTFTISHYNGPVTYSSESWLEKNGDALNPDFVSLLRGSNVAAASEQQGSSNPFMQDLFSAQAIATQAHPRNQETIVAAKQPVKPMRAPSTKRKQTIRRANTQKRKGADQTIPEEDEDSPNEIKCVAGEFNASLNLLLETLDETESWFVFCINPNDSQLPNQMENRAVKAQIKSMGLSEVARKFATVLEVNMTFPEFRDRYGAILAQAGIEPLSHDSTQDDLARVQRAMGLKENDIVMGRTKVFLSQNAFHRFEDPLRADDYGGTDASNLFPVQVSALCQGTTGSINPYVTLNSVNTTSDPNTQYHDFRAYRSTGDPEADQYLYRPDWYFEKMVEMRYHSRLGFVGIPPSDVRKRAGQGRLMVVYRGLVYDLTDYVTSPPILHVPDGVQAPGGVETEFMHPSIVEIFKQNAGKDVTKVIDGLNIDRQVLQWQRTCLRNLFTVGKADHRNSVQCQFATYILLALSCVMVAIIGFKFLAALHFGSPRAPEDHDKFVICQVPCYTEGEESLRRTIDSLAKLKYDDKRKLLFIICDGMIVGSGNDRPTPRIVLDILGADPNLDPEPLSFQSLGEGAKQHNMGKVYSGLYECAGHVVPYLVLVKVGKPTERQRPGNRGKRDSQMALMHFLNKVHFGSPMNPLELEMYHQIKNVIGVNPTFYEYCFMVDADTVVDPLSLNRLVSAMMHDRKVLGVCGETSLANSKQSIITMMQVYEYFISHHLAKAFESLFGSVTCLPGCFTMYRLRTADTHKPLFISQQVIDDYSENRVDTLHMKNLLHLGEDRYLTTLLLKHFPNYKTQFVRDAHAWTVAPDEWSVLLSQRRRWINSTIHNLAELVFLDRLCGFCCFSMRFVVFIDLLSTLVQPVTVAYLVYLVYLITVEHKEIPLLSLIMLAAIYGFQALIFIFRRKWDMIGWMIFYILAIPAFSFFLPLYSFWKMDDFSWGATRVVMGEKGKKLIVHDEGKFDPRSIPLKSWNDYENELWDKESNHSIGSWIPPEKEFGYAESRGQSLYGGTQYDPPKSRSYSPAPSMGFNTAYAPLGNPVPHSGAGSPRDGFGSRPASRNMLHGSASRPATTYLDMPVPRDSSPMMSGFDYDQAAGGQGPNDHEIEMAIRNILRNADLNSVTKRAVRQKLEEHFGVDLGARKATINSTIDRVLLEQN